MKYFNPEEVSSPRDLVKEIHVIFDGGENSFSIAELEWEGESCLGIRWNVGHREWDDPDKQDGSKICLGMPTSRAHPVWFILPEAFRDFLPLIIAAEKRRLKELE